MTYFFTADDHFGHKRILEYTNRPFASVAEMDSCLVDAWNSVVLPQDQIWHLGDFCLGPVERAIEVASRLNGHKHIVWGNHDERLRKSSEFLKLWESSHDLVTIKVPDRELPTGTQLVVLCHYALRVWDRSHYGSWSLFGHSHGSMPDDPRARSLDVGVDVRPGWGPVSYEQLKGEMKSKKWVPIDGHRGER